MKPPDREDSPAKEAETAVPASPASEDQKDDPQFFACTAGAKGYVTTSDEFLSCLAEAKGPVHISSMGGLYKQGYRLIQVVEPKEGQPIYYFDKKK